MEQDTDTTLLRLTKALDTAYNNPGRLMWRAFLSGLMSGLGATVGVAIVLSIGGFVFSRLGGIDLFKPAIQELQNMIILDEHR